MGHGLLIALVCILSSLLLGSIPFGYVVARLVKGIDIRKHGSGNIGATNVGRVVGRPFGILVFLLDGAKGFFPAFLAASGPIRLGLEGQTELMAILPLLCGAACVVGHMWPVFLKFKGGKGVATALGVFLAVATVPALIAFGVWGAVLAIGRYVSVASITAAVALPVAFALLRGASTPDDRNTLAFCGLAAAAMILKHRGNIGRLLKGTEPRIGRTRADSGEKNGNSRGSNVDKKPAM
ncbi:MAG: glycerol-3-phosphate 1-O-acyltransferase PlsY [Planctomycetota bacterium]|nr:glycerol-3-phosphate 1-O-acyltransferase PlsY [Planctomycetota bacterium]